MPLGPLLLFGGASNVNVNGLVAGITLGAPAGEIDLTLLGAVANITLGAPAGTVGLSLAGVVANIAMGVPVGSLVVDRVINGVVVNIAMGAPAGNMRLLEVYRQPGSVILPDSRRGVQLAGSPTGVRLYPPDHTGLELF